MEIAVLTMIITSNATSRICLNGNVAEKQCTLAMPPNDYICTHDPRGSHCEGFNGSYFCCATAIATKEACSDKSSFCNFLTGFCKSAEHRNMMEKDCARNCGFCKHPAAIATNQIEWKSKNQSDWIPAVNHSSVQWQLQKEASLKQWNSSVVANVTKQNRTASDFFSGIWQWTNNTRTANSTNSTAQIKPETTVSIPPAAQSKFAPSGRALVRGDRSKINVTVNDHLYGSEVFPIVDTAEPDELPISLIKTVIRGKCFDEYMYCREFTALCNHPTFSYTMAKRCALSCDRCEDVRMEEELIESSNCTDVFDNCDEHKHLCMNERYRFLLEEKCNRSCGYCTPACRDRHPNCRQYQKDGFCVDALYSVEERRHLCGDTCRMCGTSA